MHARLLEAALFLPMQNCGSPSRCARLDMGNHSAGPILILADRTAAMAKKPRKPNFNEALDILRAHSFEVQPYRGAQGGMLVTKYGAGAVLLDSGSKYPAGVVMISPGIMIRGEVARLVDRGYQKFIKSAQYELPATATHLHAVHKFSEELKELTGVESLYNEALGTVSDIYLYDRLKGREDLEPGAGQEQLTTGH